MFILGPDQPFIVQYAKFMWAALHREFGISYRLARPVTDLLAERMPTTLELAATASAFALPVGVSLPTLFASPPNQRLMKAAATDKG